MPDEMIQQVTLETQAETGYRFLGVVVKDEKRRYERKDGSGAFYKWVLAVRPVDNPIGGQTGAWHMQAPWSTFRGSPMMRTVESVKTVFGSRGEDGTVRAVGEGALIGLVGYFFLQDLITERKGRDPIIFERHLSAIESATDEEVQRARDLPVYEPPPEVSSTESETLTPSVNGKTDFTAEAMEQLAKLYDGKTEIDALRAAVGGAVKTELLPAVRSGAALRALTEAGIATTTPEGKIAVVAA